MELTNLPISLEKIIIHTYFFKKSIKKIKKVPFGCVIMDENDHMINAL